jgi:hypothetical protein
MSTPPEAIIITHRDTARKASPPWLQHGIAEKVLYAISVQLDAIADGIVAGVKMRFPGVYSNESLGLIGRERRIRRGLYELETNYALRLKRWWEDHRTRGGPYSLLTQLWYHYTPNTFPIVLVYRSGARYTMNAAGVITRQVDPYTNTLNWSRWALLYFTDEPVDPTDIAIVPRDWIAAHVLGTVKVIPSGGELWNFPAEMIWNQAGTWNTADITIDIPVSASL